MDAPSIIVLLCFTLTPGESVLTVTPENKTLPSSALPRVFTNAFIKCDIEADFNLSDSTVQSQWILPNGTVLELRHNDGKYFTNQGPTVDSSKFETFILIQELVYSDAGTYTCQVQDIHDPDNRGPWMSSETTLQLLVELTADKVEVVIFDNATSVSLSCEMSLYLRPDEDLQWFRGGQLISDTNERYTITYTDGTEEGQFGNHRVGKSRVSTLVISQPQSSDSATYTCAIRDTEQSQDIQLTVESTGGPDPSTVQQSSTPTRTNPTMTTPTTIMPTMSSSSMPTITPPPREPTILLPIIIGAIAGVLGITAVILIIIVLFLTHKRKYRAATSTNVQPDKEDVHMEPYYDYIPDQPELSPPRVLLSTSNNPSYGVVQDPAIDTDLNISYGLTKREPNEEESLNMDGLTQPGRDVTQPQSQDHFAYREPSLELPPTQVLPSTSTNPSYGVMQDSTIDTDLNISYGLTEREPNEQKSLNIESRDGLTQPERGDATQPQSQERFVYREPSPAPLSDNFLPTEINPSCGVFS